MKSKKKAEYTYAEKFQLDPALFDEIKIEAGSSGFSVRTFNRLIKAGVLTVGDLLRVKESDLWEIDGLGQKCMNEITAFFQMLTEKSSEIDKPQIKIYRPTEKLRLHKDDICAGKFSFAEELELTNAERACLSAMQEGYDLLDHNLILQAMQNSNSVLLIQQMLKDIVEQQAKKQQLVEAVKQVPADRLHTSVSGYINTFSENETTRDSLRSVYGTDEAAPGDILGKFSIPKEKFGLILEFAKWCAFDISEELQQLIGLIHAKENMKIVLRERSNNHTLDAAGQILGVTRERVRQIENKARHIFVRWYNRTRILSQIAAIRDGDYILTPIELQEYFGQYTSEILYLLRTTDDLPYLYDSQRDAFIVEELDQSERVQNFVEELPDTFNISKVDSIQKEAVEKCLSVELMMLSINDVYTLTGNTYHRNRLSLTEICRVILKKYYQEGMNVYDDQQISMFRRYVESDFGKVALPKQDRALAADIIRVSVLCGRGRYKIYENEAISGKLLDAICRYIDDSDKNIFLTNTLFSVFEEELLAEGIDNKYFLQGLMHRQLGDRYVFKRDYVSKDNSSTSIYMEIGNYIKQFNHPISKKQVFSEYPGITEIVFNFSVSDPKIINLHGEYIHADQMDFRKEDIKYFKAVLEEKLSENGCCNVKDVYEFINKKNPISMRRLYIMYQYSLFSVLEYLFRDEYQFSRPYIAYSNVDIFHASERMDELIRSADEITLAEIQEYAREIHFGIYSILDFVNEHNDTHLLKNDKELISIEGSGIDERCFEKIEELILDEIKGTMLISDLKCICKFPRISVPWTEWLIYSVVKRWSDQLDVGAESSISSRKFRHMCPIIAPKGKLSVNEINLTDADGVIGAVDDLDYIDDLIADVIVEEIGDL